MASLPVSRRSSRGPEPPDRAEHRRPARPACRRRPFRRHDPNSPAGSRRHRLPPRPVRLSGNPAIEEMTAPLWPHLMRSMATVLREPDYATRVWHQEHAAILRHILAGDAVQAEDALARMPPPPLRV